MLQLAETHELKKEYITLHLQGASSVRPLVMT